MGDPMMPPMLIDSGLLGAASESSSDDDAEGELSLLRGDGMSNDSILMVLLRPARLE